MASRRAIRITLQSQLKRCPNGHVVGDTWIVEGKTPAGMCLSAFHSLSPFLMALRFGGDFPWEEAGEATVCCPDPEVVNVFRIERIARDEPA
ncbi:MAG TPA: TIGR04076 family protein [Anaeromyxobacter sp.]